VQLIHIARFYFFVDARSAAKNFAARYASTTSLALNVCIVYAKHSPGFYYFSGVKFFSVALYHSLILGYAQRIPIRISSAL